GRPGLRSDGGVDPAPRRCEGRLPSRGRRGRRLGPRPRLGTVDRGDRAAVLRGDEPGPRRQRALPHRPGPRRAGVVGMIAVRPTITDADLEKWIRVRRAVLPNESAGTVEQLRVRTKPENMLLVAELDGELAGSGLAGLSDAPGRAFVAPRVLPKARRRGVGRELLR